MSKITDILLDNSGDLMFQNGDLVCGDSTKQHQNLLILTEKGEWKQNPTMGVGVSNYLLDDNYLPLKNEIEAQFEKDGITIESIQINNSKIQIIAEYES